MEKDHYKINPERKLIMKIAYIILCHKNAKQINMMIDALNDKENIFFIHLDKKSNIENLIKMGSNIHILPEDKRIDIKWGNISMIKATKNLLQAVFNSKEKYDYVWLLSGQDFPLKNQSEIKKYLEENRGKNFIEVIDQSDLTYNRLLKRNELYYPEWLMKMSLFSRVTKIIYMIVTGGLSKTLFLKRKNFLNVKFYFGSQWWVLTYDCIFDIYSRLDLFSSYYKNCLVPDESIFQTLFMNSNYKDTCEDKLTLVDWNGQVNHPKTFTINDYDELINSNYLMARKFDENIDDNIIKMLYDNLKNN